MVHHLSPIILVVIACAYFAFSIQTYVQVRAIRPDGNAKRVATLLIAKCVAMSALFMSSLLQESDLTQDIRAALGVIVAVSLCGLVYINYPRVVASLLDKRD